MVAAAGILMPNALHFSETEDPAQASVFLLLLAVVQFLSALLQRFVSSRRNGNLRATGYCFYYGNKLLSGTIGNICAFLLSLLLNAVPLTVCALFLSNICSVPFEHEGALLALISVSAGLIFQFAFASIEVKVWKGGRIVRWIILILAIAAFSVLFMLAANWF